MWLLFEKYQVLYAIVLVSTKLSACDAITNTSFNSNIREYSINDSNVSGVKTLQKQELGRYANFAPAGKPIKFKEIPDSDLSSSSHSRGLLYHEHPGYGLIDYEETPYYGHEYHIHDSGHQDFHSPHVHHDFDHHDHHNSGHHHYPSHHQLDHGHYKHHNHALAAKTILWPIAGIALLGAAAALVSNPVLLQLGVVSGRRKRRDTEEISGPDFPADSFRNYAKKISAIRNSIHDKTHKESNVNNENIERRIFRKDVLRSVKQVTSTRPAPQPYVKHSKKYTNTIAKYREDNDDDGFIPIPLKLRNSDVSN